MKNKKCDKLNLEEKLNAFRNQVCCRNNNNQFLARKIWNKIKSNFDEKIRRDFEIEWSHYMLNEMSTSQFGEEIKKLLLTKVN